MGITFRIEDKDLGMAKIAQSLRDLGAEAVRAGSVATDGGDTTPTFIDRRTNEPVKPSVTVAGMLAKHEFGDAVPVRSVIRAVFDESTNEAGDAIRDAIGNAIDARHGPAETQQATGDFFAEKFRAWILEGTHLQELAEATKADPGRDPRFIPLLDTGQILDSLAWRKEKA